MSQFDVAYLSIDSISEGVGASQILTLVEELSKLDMKISLLTFEKSSPPTWVEDRIRNSRIDWKPLAFAKHGTLAGVGRLGRLIRNVPDARVLHGRSDLPSLAGLLSRKGPVLWDVRSLWGEQRAILNPTQFKPGISTVLNKIEGIDAHRASAMSSLTRAVVPYLESRHGYLPPIRSVIPTCVDLDRFPLQPLPSGEINVLLSGTFNAFYDLDLMRNIISELKHRTNVNVVWARDSAAAKSELGVEESSVISLKHSEMPAAIAASHFGLALCKMNSGPSLLAAMPTKVAEFWATGRPVLVTAGIGDLDEMIKEHRVGVIITDTTKIDDALDELFVLLSDRETQARCRAVAERYFDIKQAAIDYSTIYSKLHM